VPFWLIWAFAGRKGMLQIWPAILVAGGSFAIAQFVVSNYHGPMLVDVIASLVSMASLIAFLKVWKPKKIWTSAKLIGHEEDGGEAHPAPTDIPQKADKTAVRRAWMPWVILTVFVFIWGLPEFKKAVDTVPVLENGLPVLDAKGLPKVAGNTFLAPVFKFEDIHEKIEKVPPVVAKSKKEEAAYKLNWFTTTGTGILLAALFAGLMMGYRPLQLVSQFGKTVWMVRYSLTTIVAMLALGYLTRFAGIDATLGLAFAFTGVFYPFFGTFLGWLGVALTGSDTASNVLFGGLQRTTAEQLGISPVLMAAANSSGGVMGKMIDAQSIVVASTATHWYGHEGEILRYVFFHSIALCTLMGLFITAQAYVWPFTAMVLK
jgi:lactate permease